MSYKNIICPVDGSELGDRALDEAIYLSKISGAKLTLLYVSEKAYKAVLMSDSNEWDSIREGWLAEGRELLLKERAKVEASGIKDCDQVLRDGEVSNEVISEAMEKGADLIVMASHRYSPVGKLFHGSVIDRVTKRSTCPVLWVFK
ncbi:MAG: universal stress protein [Deltaproteobacteria bacterium]